MSGVWGGVQRGGNKYSEVLTREGQVERWPAVVCDIAHPHYGTQHCAHLIGHRGSPMEHQKVNLPTFAQGLRKEERRRFSSGSSSGPRPHHLKRSLLPARWRRHNMLLQITF